MQELVLLTYCDVDFEADSVQVEAEEVVWFLNGEPVVVDLCRSHRKEYSLDDMDEIAASYGRPLKERRASGLALEPDEPEKSKEKVHCPYPGCKPTRGGGYKNRGSMASHFRQQHGMSVATWLAMQRGEEPRFTCTYRAGKNQPECGDRFVDLQSFGTHVRSAHKIRLEELEKA